MQYLKLIKQGRDSLCNPLSPKGCASNFSAGHLAVRAEDESLKFSSCFWFSLDEKRGPLPLYFGQALCTFGLFQDAFICICLSLV